MAHTDCRVCSTAQCRVGGPFLSSCSASFHAAEPSRRVTGRINSSDLPPGTTLKCHRDVRIPAGGSWSCPASPCYGCGKTPVALPSEIQEPWGLQVSSVVWRGSWNWQLQAAPGWIAAILEGASSPEDRNKTGLQEHSSTSH